MTLPPDFPCPGGPIGVIMAISLAFYAWCLRTLRSIEAWERSRRDD